MNRFWANSIRKCYLCHNPTTKLMQVYARHILLMFCIVIFSLASNAKDSIYYSLRNICKQATESSNHRLALETATRLYQISKKNSNLMFQAYASYYQGVSNVLLGNGVTGKQQLEAAEQLTEKLDNDTLIVLIYNGYGIYEANNNNYSVAQQHFIRSLRYAIKTKDRFKQVMTEANLAEIAYVRKDTTGLKYATGCYEWAVSNRNKQVMLIGAYQCANLLHMMNRPHQALEYLKIADNLAVQEKYMERCAIYKLYGDIYLALHQYEKAISALEKALHEKENAQAATLPEVYLCYAQVRAAQGHYEESNQLIKKGIEIAKEKKTISTLTDFYQLEAYNYEATGNNFKALQTFKLYKNTCDTIYNIEKEHTINELNILYRIEKREQEADYQKTLLKQEVKKNTILLLLMFCLLLVSGVLYYFYYKQNKLYKAIALQNRDAMKKEEALHKKIKEISEHSNKSSGQQLNEEKATILYEQICELMEEKRLYTDNNLTRERLAEILNTNRTYLSQIINKKAGISYSQFINNYRIKEAIRILSKAETNDYPLKSLYNDLGFSSITTFYKLFQDTVGMTPSTYRKTILNLETNKKQLKED